MRNELSQKMRGIDGVHLMRDGALSRLSDEDLDSSPGGNNCTLGYLLKELADLQHSYTESLRTFRHDLKATVATAEVAQSVEALEKLFTTLDEQMAIALSRLQEEDYERLISRSDGVRRTVVEQLEIYNQALLIFFGKLVIYFHSMEKSLPEAIKQYFA